MTDFSTLPGARRSAAIPRWSHRDPVEDGNPFPPDDPRHPSWDSATRRAKGELARLDAELEQHGHRTTDPALYQAQLLRLAEGRFDVWAQRGLSVVWSDRALRDYEQWLAIYEENWLAYVGDTCPNVEVGDELRARLTRRVEHWTTEARTCLADSRTSAAE